METLAWLPGYILTGTLFMTVSLAFVVSRRATPFGRSRRRGMAAMAVLIIWLGLATWLAGRDVYNGATHAYPTIEFGLGIPILLGLALSLTRAGRALLDDLSQGELVAVQVYRVLGGVFLYLWAQGRMPALFAWPAGMGDILIGLAAPWVARTGDRNAIRLWNLLGLADLFIAVATGFLTSPSPLQLFAFDNPNLLITAFPLVLVPTFLVPASVVLHILSLRKLSAARITAQSPSPKA